MADRVECVVVGAGVVGLAVARALALAGREVLLLEAEPQPGTITSARNSGVIHAGLYYAPGSFKARFCVAGNRALYRYCNDRGIEHRNCGKLIVANGDEEEQVLLHLLERAHANDVDGVRLISAARCRSSSREVRSSAALLCPTSGILDQHPYMLALEGDFQNAGGILVCDCRVESLSRLARRISREDGRRGATEVEARFVVNSAGLGAVDLLKRIEGYPRGSNPHDAPGPRQLLHRRRALAIQAPHLPGAARRGARHPRHPRPRQARALRSGRRVDRPHRLFGERRARARCSTKRSGGTGRDSRTAR